MIAAWLVFAAPLLLVSAIGALVMILIGLIAMTLLATFAMIGSWIIDTINPDGPDDASEDGSGSVIARW